MTFEEWLRDIPEDWEPEPFCYFIPAYCDVAYDFEKCEKCPEAQKAWAKYRKEHNHDSDLSV